MNLYDHFTGDKWNKSARVIPYIYFDRVHQLLFEIPVMRVVVGFCDRFTILSLYVHDSQ